MLHFQRRTLSGIASFAAKHRDIHPWNVQLWLLESPL